MWALKRAIGELKGEFESKRTYIMCHPFWSPETKMRKIESALGKFKKAKVRLIMLHKMCIRTFGPRGEEIFWILWERGISPKIIFARNFKFYDCFHFGEYIPRDVCEILLRLRNRFQQLIFACPPSIYKRLRSDFKQVIFVPARVKEMKKWIRQLVWEEINVGYMRNSRNYRDVQMEISSKYGLDLTIKFIRYCQGLMYSRYPPPKPPEPVEIRGFVRFFDPGDLLWEKYLRK